MLKNTSIVIALVVLSTFAMAQNLTVGLLYSSENVTEGYTLFSPEESNDVYLINNCGEVVNEWTFSELPGLTVYLLPNGNLLRAGKDSLEIRNWDNELVWSYAMTLNGLPQHHDIEPLPNGNILCLITHTLTNAAAIGQGRNPSLMTAMNFRLDKIVELQPVGTNQANVVWEWKFVDHLVQEFDNTKPNYAAVIDHPELLDLNFENGYDQDWVHCNSIDYHAELDQILISARHLNELYIIDHSTTTTQAASHAGGNAGRGGDLLWRWGNPQVYRQGTALDQQLFLQHDAQWVEPGFLDEGKISVFNNVGDGSGNFSSIHLLSPSLSQGVYEMANSRYSPPDFDWSWNGSILGNVMNENKKCGVQSLPNGNLLVCETSLGRVSEITKTGQHLWSYRNPVGEVLYNQYTTPSNNTIFRATKFASSYAGFIGQDMSPLGLIENENELSASCTQTVAVTDLSDRTPSVNCWVNNRTLYFSQTEHFDVLELTDLSGKLVLSRALLDCDQLSLGSINSGVYVLRCSRNAQVTSQKLLVQ